MSFLKNTWKNKTLLLMCVPAIIIFFLFSYMPMGGLVLAFKKFDFSLGFASPWSGLENFKFIFNSGEIFSRITKNTIFYFLLFTVFGTIFNVTLAIAINELAFKKAGKLFQSVMIIPAFISAMAVSYVVNAFLSTDKGMLNQLLAAFGKDSVRWYLDASVWPLILLIVKIWQGTGYGSVLYLSVLSGIDQEMYEAADLDGASKWKQIRYITIPMLIPMITVMTLLSIGGIMHSDTGLFYQVTKNTGALYSTTQVIDSYVLNAIMTSSNFGTTAAVTLYQSLVGFILVIVVNLIVRKIEPENALF